MIETEPSKRRHRTTGEFVVAGIVGAIVGWPITKALDGLTANNQWPWWVYLLGVIFTFALVLFVMTLLITRWRHAFWGSVRRGFMWLWSWHPVSARRLRASQAAQNDGIDQFLATNLPHVIRRVVKDDNEADARMKEVLKPFIDQIVKRRLEAITTTSHADPIWETPASAVPSIPLPASRWTIRHNEFDLGNDEWVLTNQVPRSVAREVRIEGVEDIDGYSGITILDAGHFEDLSGTLSGAFKASFDQASRWHGASFAISWYDEAAVQQWEHIHFPGWETKPGTDVWSTTDSPF